jgi:hypothetical protein
MRGIGAAMLDIDSYDMRKVAIGIHFFSIVVTHIDVARALNSPIRICKKENKV